MASPNEMDIMSMVTNMLTGLQQNMRQGRQDELGALSMLAKLPGMELTPATGAQPANIFKALLGMPGYQPGPDGAPVTAIGGMPFTVTKAPSAQDFFKTLLAGDTASGMPAAQAASTGGLATPQATMTEGDVATLPEVSVQARRARTGGMARNFGLTGAELQADPGIQALLWKKGSAPSDLIARMREMRKEKEESRSSALKQHGDLQELVGRAYYGVRNQDGLDAANADLEDDPVLSQYPDMLARLPRQYTPETMKAFVQRATPLRDLTEADRAVDRVRAVGPEETRIQVDREARLGPLRTNEAINREARLGPLRTNEAIAREQQLGPLRTAEDLRKQALEEPGKLRLAQQGDEPKRRFAAEDKLRDEFTTITKPYRAVADAYGRVIASSTKPSAAGDIALIYSYMKILDPESVVREGEYATAQNAGGVPDRIRAQYNKIVSGERLSPIMRDDFVDRAKRLYDQHTTSYTKTRDQYRTLAERNQVNPDNVTLDFTSTAQPATQSKRLSPQDIDASWRGENVKRKAEGKPPITRQQLIDAARAEGFEVQ